jgi:hypothetical protein
MKHKYRTYNYGLAALLQVSLILDIVTLFRLDWGDRIIDICLSLNVALGTIFLFGVLLYRIDTYSWIATGAITTLVAIVSSLLYYHRDIDPLVMISLALIVISFVLGMFLGVKLCPQRIPKTIEVDIDGVEKINKTIYVFPD